MPFKPVTRGAGKPARARGQRIDRVNAFALPSTPRPERIRVLSPGAWARVEEIRDLSPALRVMNIINSALKRDEFKEDYVGGELSTLGRTEYTRVRLATEEVVEDENKKPVLLFSDGGTEKGESDE